MTTQLLTPEGTSGTLAGALGDFARHGFTERLSVVGNGLRVLASPLTFGPERVVIRAYRRFEGASDPDDMEIVYAIETDAGLRGTLVDAYGVYADPVISAFLNTVPMTHGLGVDTIDFNLLVSASAWAPERSRREIRAVLRAIGDSAPLVEPTERQGMLAVRTTLDPRVSIRAVRALHHESPAAFRYTRRWVPIDIWSGADLESLRRAVTELRPRIAAGERWRMNVERRAPECPPVSEIITACADLIANTVDLSHPDKILRIELFRDRAALAVVTPEETMSVVKASAHPRI
jgi:tRNA(Ser,Leu) C12 N-acetylase TAN1